MASIGNNETVADAVRRILALTEPSHVSDKIVGGDIEFVWLDELHEWPSSSRANDALTLSSAHRLLGTLRDETQSRSVHDECEDVMRELERMVEGA